jgi:hypothetical protein
MIIIILLFIMSFSAYAVMWTLQFHFGISRFKNLNPKFWNPAISFENKWKTWSNGNIIIYANGKKIERFPGSSTIFVWTTDAFHLFQFIFLNSLFISVSLIADGKVVYGYSVYWWQAFLGIRLMYAVVFEWGFGKLLIKK